MKYWIFGAGTYGKECYELCHNQLDICGFIDNDKDKVNKVCCGLCVISYSKFKALFNENDERIVIASTFFDEIYVQLMNDNYEVFVEKVYSRIGGITSFEKCWDKTINSSCGEDLWLKSFFKSYPMDYKGTYVDVGAHHPFYASNTRWAYDAGWRGINIDAKAECIKLFEKFRPDDRNINCGVSDVEGEMDFFVFSNASPMSTFDKNVFNTQNLKIKEVRKVPVKTLNQILEENDVHAIDFLDIDVEGLDEKIITSFDWKKYNPKCVLVEILNQNSIEEVLNTEIHKKMVEEGYRIVNYAMLTAMYIK